MLRIDASKSRDVAVVPVTPASTPGSEPTVAGTSSSRMVSGAALDAASVPVPSVGSAICAIVPGRVHVDGDRLVDAAARERLLTQALDRRLLLRVVDRGRLDDDHGRVLLARESGLQPVVRLHRGEILREGLRAGHDGLHAERRNRERHQHAGRDECRDRRPPEDAVERPAPKPAPSPRCKRRTKGTRAELTRSPSHESSPGSTVSDPTTAIATTVIVAIANEPNVLSPVKNMPAIATITVSPEISTERPDVAAAASSAACSLRPAARSSRSRFK